MFLIANWSCDWKTDHKLRSFLALVTMWIAVLTFLTGLLLAVDGCTHPPDDIFNIHMIGFSTDFRFERHANLEESTLYIIYEWKISKLPRLEFDGYLYKLIDRELQSSDEQTDTPDGLYKSAYDPKACVGLNSTLWALDSNKTAQLCTIPCEKYLPPVCEYSKVCTLRRMNYSLLEPTATRLEFPIEFGRVYDLNLMFYKNWHTGRSSVIDGSQVVAYCKHELVTNQNLSHDDARQFCLDKMDYSDSAKASGPPTHFKMSNATYNLTSNRASIHFQWQAPYDIAPDLWLAGFWVYVRKDAGPSGSFKVKTNTTTNSTEYSLLVDDIEMGRRNWIMIVPKLDLTTDCGGVCHKYGLTFREIFKVPDIDACDSGNRYCAEKANCIDNPVSITVGANCSCPDGFSGNGISTVWSGGTGCYANEKSSAACSPGARGGICDTVASCVNATCICPLNYIGDGYRSGTGCSHRGLVIGLGISAPLVAILLIIIGWFIWRGRNAKKNGPTRLQEENL